jgi:hypothetical protein
VTSSVAPSRDATSKQLALSRRAALLIAAGIFAVLALGWLADTAGLFAPAPSFTNGQAQRAGVYTVALALDPAQPRAGKDQLFAVRVSDNHGHAISGQNVRVIVSMPPMDMPPHELGVTSGQNGAYTAHGSFPMVGLWTVTVQVGSGAAAGETSYVVRVRS